PADVLLAHLPPWRPPGEHALVVRVELAPDIDQALADQRAEELALLGELPDHGLALHRVHVHLGERDVDVAAEHDLAALRAQRLRPAREALHELDLRRIALAAVRHVYRGEHRVADLRLHHARLHVELGMAEHRLGRMQFLADVQRHAGVRTHAVPEDVVALNPALLGNLRRLRLQLLQADDVGLVALEPVAELRLPRADAVDVPGGDLQSSSTVLNFAGRTTSRSSQSFE